MTLPKPWTIHAHLEGGYAISNGNGDIVGEYRDEKSARSHHAMALAELEQLRKSDLHLPAAVESLRKSMQSDPDYAWGWQSNLAIAVMDTDSSISHETANRAAALFMHNAFNVDVTQFDQWKAFDWVKKGCSKLDPEMIGKTIWMMFRAQGGTNARAKITDIGENHYLAEDQKTGEKYKIFSLNRDRTQALEWSKA